MEYFIGIDIGGTNMKFGVVDQDGNLIQKEKHPTAEMRKGNPLENIAGVLHAHFEQHPHITKVGIGVPGTVSKDRLSTIELANLPELNHQPILPYLQKRFPSCVFHLENDANAAALGEFYFSKGALPKDFIFITLGTGVGGAAVIDGQIFKGADGNGMEIGHIVVGNGKTLEQNIGKKGILGMALTTLEGYEGWSVLADLHQPMNSKDVVQAAHDKDELALEIFAEVGRYLGEAIVSSVRLLDIKTILIGGGVSETFEYVKGSMNQVISKHLTPYYTSKMDVRLASLGNNAGIIGAASLCFMD